jgi:hypothetical protein
MTAEHRENPDPPKTLPGPDDRRPSGWLTTKNQQLTTCASFRQFQVAPVPGGPNTDRLPLVCILLRAIALAKGVNTPADPQIERRTAAKACWVMNGKKRRRMPFLAPRRRLSFGRAAKDYSSSSFFGLYWAMMF